jgi:hypothetical protein
MREKMNIVTTLKQKTGYIVASAALVLGVVAPGLISVYVSAAQLTTRSIALSSSSIQATNVSYEIKFTAPSAAGAFVVEFCSNSADTATACVAPTGLSAAGAGTVTADYTASGAANEVTVLSTITAAEDVSVDVTGMTNPDDAGPLYARIATFADATDATAGTPVIDNGSVVIAITNTISVSGAVLETMTFCVADAVITANCANAAANLPTLEIGETVGSTIALQPGSISTGTLYTQITTNAATGAVINLKSATDCGGMKRVGAAICDIAPTQQVNLIAGTAAFGVMTSTASGNSIPGANGTLQPVSGSGYSPSTYAFNYVVGNATGVTSTFGDPFLDTAGAPVNNQNMQLTFGASVSNNTPAGNYSTSLSMIATGKF